MVLGKKSLTQLMGDEWKFHRRLIAKSFSYQHLMHMTADMNLMADRFACALLKTASSSSSSGVVDVSMACKAATLDVIGITVFGTEFHCIEQSLENSPVAKAFDFLLSELTRRQFGNPVNLKNYLYSFPCENNAKFLAARRTVRTLCSSSSATSSALCPLPPPLPPPPLRRRTGVNTTTF
jgi:cytochrome P450